MHTITDSLNKYHLLDDKAAAPILGVAPATLKNSRYLKTLNGKPTPAFIKLGRSVRYRPETLLEWIERYAPASETDQSAQK